MSFYQGFVAALSVIVVSELGDNTWFIAVIMSMRHSRLTVFSGAMAANALMHILSVCLAWTTHIVPQAITQWLSTALFAYFGWKMIKEAYRMRPDKEQAEYKEAVDELRKYEAKKKAGKSNRNSTWLMFSFVSRVFIEAFTLTFLAEWGDRSQITTIALGARENMAGVIIGGILGHAICTGIAVVGGKLVAQRISIRTVTFIGGVLFILYALSSAFGLDDD